MGWLTGWDSKSELISHLESDSFYAEGYKALKHSLVGNNHWTLLEKPDGSVTISLELISGRGGDWGYKGLCESMGPTQLNCPIGFIKSASAPSNDWAKEWREKVVNFHKARKDRPVYAQDQVWRIWGKEYQLTKPAGPRKGWIGVLIETGELFRLPFTHLSKGQLIT